MKKETAVEWLIEKYNIVCGLGSFEHMKEHIEKAKAMEEQQIDDAWDEGWNYGSYGYCYDEPNSYYIENFKTETP